MPASSDPLPPSQEHSAEPDQPPRTAAPDVDPPATHDSRPDADGEVACDVAEEELPVPASPDRVEKLLALRRAIAQGTYAVNPERIARRLADDL